MLILKKKKRREMNFIVGHGLFLFLMWFLFWGCGMGLGLGRIVGLVGGGWGRVRMVMSKGVSDDEH